MSNDIKNKSTVRWISSFLLTMFIIYTLVSMGKTIWINWIAILFGFFISGFLFIQAGVIEYLRKKDYKKIGIGDFVVWISFITATAILINSLLLINIIKENAPTWLLSFSATIGVIVGITGGLVSLVHLISPTRFK